MANHPQAKKRNRQRILRQARNRYQKSTMRSLIKKVRLAVSGKDFDQASEALGSAVPLIDRCGSRGIIPKERAARYVARLTTAVNALRS